MDDLQSVLNKVIAKRGLKDEVDAAVLVTKANDWLADQLQELKQYIQVTKLKDGELFVEVEHSIAAQEMQLIAHQLEEYLAQYSAGQQVAVRILRS